MSNIELLEIVIKLVDFLNNEDNDAFDVSLKGPDGGRLKCHFHYEVELPEDNNDD